MLQRTTVVTDMFIVAILLAWYIAGLLHIVHNCFHDMRLVLLCWNDSVAQLKHVCRMLSRRRSLARLLETCFSHGPFVHMRKDLQEFGKAEVDKGRWGSVSAAAGKVLLVQRVLKALWSMETFTHGQVAKEEE